MAKWEFKKIQAGNLAGPYAKPMRTENPEFLIVMIHGFGANGDNLISLCEVWGPHLPTTAFFAPNAFDPCRGCPGGYQWFELNDPYGMRLEIPEMRKGLEPALANFTSSLKMLSEHVGVPVQNIILMGFSQGGTMALQLGLEFVPEAKGVLMYSGFFLDPSRVPEGEMRRPPVLLVHGDMDAVVPVFAQDQASESLASMGVSHASHVCEGLDHAISSEGLMVGLKFLHEIMPEGVAISPKKA